MAEYCTVDESCKIKFCIDFWFDSSVSTARNDMQEDDHKKMGIHEVNEKNKA
jgi:hypothetical protein